MLNLLTKYLLQYRTVTIPGAGTFQIVQQPPQLDIADKRILPPVFIAQLVKEEAVSQHQLLFLNACLGKDDRSVLDDLRSFGHHVSNKINGAGFEWKGVGKFDENSRSISIALDSLPTVPAERVMRENRDHKVLVGDRQTSSHQIADEKAFTADSHPAGRFGVMTIGWVLFFLSILAIALLLFTGKFKTNAGGYRLSPTGSHILEDRIVKG